MDKKPLRDRYISNLILLGYSLPVAEKAYQYWQKSNPPTLAARGFFR